ncbi:MAG: ATP-binding cassette domain-containing protein [Thermostichales cyanobacterium DRC_bins_46]
MGELQLRQISVAYGGRRVLEDVTATVMAGALTGIIGPNGAGKSTLLKAILGLVPRLRGEVTYGGSRLRREQVAYVPQRQGVAWQDAAIFRTDRLARCRGGSSNGCFWLGRWLRRGRFCCWMSRWRGLT